MRFRIKIDVEAAKAARTDESLTHKKTEEQEKSQVSPWGPFSSAVASGKFRHDGLRDSEARYDLGEGVVLDLPPATVVWWKLDWDHEWGRRGVYLLSVYLG